MDILIFVWKGASTARLGVAILLAFCLCLYGQAVSDLISEGVTLLQAGSAEAALVKFDEAVQRDPQSVPAHYQRASALVRTKQPRAAIAELTRVTEIDPAFAPARYNLALLLEHGGDFKAAREQLALYIDLKPDDPAGSIHLILDTLQTGASTEAVRLASDAVRRFPGSTALRSLEARCLLSAGNLMQADALLRQTLQRDPNSVNDNLMFGIAEAELHGTGAARPYIEKSLALDPHAALGYDLLGNLDLRTGNYEEAAKNFQTAVALAPENDLYAYGAALALERLDRLAQALPFAEKAIQLKPDRATNRFLLGKLYAKTGKNDAAVEQLRECIRLNPEADAAYYLLSQVYVRAGNRAAAQECSRRFDELQRARDKAVGLGTPASETLRLDQPPAPWDRSR